VNLWQKNSEIKSKKSPGLAFIYSLLVPGMGQLYTGRFDVGKYFIISEAALWLGFAAFTIYGNWLFDDAVNYAVFHAGINKEDKDDEFFTNIGIFDNVDQYNQEKLLRGEYDKIYYPGTGYDFYWDNIESRKKYREDELSSGRIHNDRLFIAGAVLINHIVSAISAIVLTNKYNSGISKGSGGITLRADVTKHFNRIDGLKLKFTKSF
jgi:TM2 domain-containing membrane protein YozV